MPATVSATASELLVVCLDGILKAYKCPEQLTYFKKRIVYRCRCSMGILNKKKESDKYFEKYFEINSTTRISSKVLSPFLYIRIVATELPRTDTGITCTSSVLSGAYRSGKVLFPISMELVEDDSKQHL